MKKNDSLVLEITDLTAEGSGVGRAEDSMTVFVPRTAVGDRVRVHIIKVKKNYAVGKVEAVFSLSPEQPESSIAEAAAVVIIRFKAFLFKAFLPKGFL